MFLTIPQKTIRKDLDDLEDGKWPFSSEPHDKTVQQAAKTATEQGAL